MAYSRQLLETEPDNPGYQAELSYALSNLGTVSMERHKSESALEYFQQSAALSEVLVANSPGDMGLRVDLGNGYSWVGAAYLRLGLLQDSEAAYQKAVDVLSKLHEESGSPIHAENLAQNEYHLGNILAHRGELARATEQFRVARRLLDELVAHDADNAIWRVDRAISAYHLGELARVTDDPETAREALGVAARDLRILLGIDPADVRSACFLALTERSLGLLEPSSELATRAHARARALVAITDTLKPQTALVAAMPGTTYGRILSESGYGEAAAAAWSHSLRVLDRARNAGPAEQAVRSALMCNLGRTEEAVALQADLAAYGLTDGVNASSDLTLRIQPLREVFCLSQAPVEELNRPCS